MNKNKSFLQHFMVIGTGTLVSMFIGLISTPIITRIVDPDSYGQLSIFIIYVNIGEMILCLGLDQALVRFFYEKNNIDYKRALLFKCIKLPVFMTIIFSVCLLIVNLFFQRYFEFCFWVNVWLCACILIQVIYRFSQLLLRLEYNSKKYSILNILRKASYLIFVLVLIIFCKDYFYILIIATVTSVAIAMILSIVWQSDMWNIKLNRPNMCFISEKELLAYSWPFIISMGITQIFQATDKIILNAYRTYAEVGIYSSTMTLVNIFAIIQTTFNALWGPMQIKHYTEFPEDHTFYQKGNQNITVVMFFIGLSLILSKGVFAILLGDKYREAAYILPFLIFSPIMYTISETTMGGLIFKKKSKLQIVIALCACVTNIIGNIILVPQWGGQGAAIATGTSYIVFFTLRTVLSNRYYYTDFKLKKFYLLTFITLIYAFYATFHSFNIVLLAGYILSIGLLYFLYKDTIKWGVLYLRKSIGNLL